MCCGKNTVNLGHLPLAQIQSPCNYTLEQVKAWKNILLCYKKQNSNDSKQINSYLGIVVSAISYGKNFCYFKTDLEKIEPYILTILNTEQCL